VIYLEERQVRCPTGSFVFIPACIRHGFQVGDVPSRKLNLYIPSAMVGYFDTLGASIASGASDPATLGHIALRYGTEVTCPVPEDYI